MNKIIHILFVILFHGISISQNTGSIKGIVIDKETSETLSFVNIILKQNDSIVTNTLSNFDGKFTIDSINEGVYDLETSYVGFSTIIIEKIKIQRNKITFMDTLFVTESSIIICNIPNCSPIDLSPPSKTTLTTEKIKRIVGTQVSNTFCGSNKATISKTPFPGSICVAEQQIYFKGTKSIGYTYIDGVKTIGTTILPFTSIKSSSIYTGGLPAKYGDTHGGVTVIETKSYFDIYNQRNSISW